MISGAIFLLGLAVTIFCLPLIRVGVHDFLQLQFSLAPNTLFTAVWKDVPVTPKIEVYVFNVTNHEAYLSGREGKLSVEEIGPFVYHAKQTKGTFTYDSAIVSDFWTFGIDILYSIHATSFTSSSFGVPPPPPNANVICVVSPRT